MKSILLITLTLLIFGCGGNDSGGSDPTPTPIIAEKSRPLLVVRLNYDNIAFTSDATSWAQKIFGTQEGQMNHFYAENSLDQFTFYPVTESEGTPNDGIVTLTLEKEHPDPGSEYTLLHPDFKSALEAADAYVDFSAYDSDGNGALSSKELIVVFILAGNEEAYGPATQPGVFAHQYCTSGSNVAHVDGVSVTSCDGSGNYAVFGERHGSHDATIGIIAHELGHAAFDLPDLYDTTPSGEPDSAGIGYFGLMSAGMWGHKAFLEYEGSSPVHFCAWSKMENGWIEPETISDTTALHVELHESASETYNVYKLPVSESEYYLIENRNNSGYDQGLFAAINGKFKGGMALWKINQSVLDATWTLNKVNADKDNKGVAIIEASRAALDDSAYERGHAKNLFYSGNVDHYEADGIRIDNVSSRGSVMSATLNSTYKETP